MQQDDEERAELVTFQVKAACIYSPLPPATTYGHRAETWDVENYFREVRVRVVSVGDALYIRLEDIETGELFAECPLPSDGSPLTRAVEPVVDSSRYYVLRVVDRADEKKHAYLGLGFRDRGESSAFSAALDEYRQYLRRKAEAEAMRLAHMEGGEGAEEAPGGSPTSSGEGLPRGSGSGAARKFALPAGQTISLKLPGTNSKSRRTSIEVERSGSSSEGKPQLTRVFSLNETIAGVRISPPPPPGAAGLIKQASGAPPALADWAVFSPGSPSHRGSGGLTIARGSMDLTRSSGDTTKSSGEMNRSSADMNKLSGEMHRLSREARSLGEGEDAEWGEFQTTAV